MIFLSVFMTSFQAAHSELFRFQFTEGDTYRIHSKVTEDVIFNGRHSHQAEIINRVVVRISDVVSEGTASALHTGTFMTSEKNNKNTFSWGREYQSVFRRNALGIYTIDESYFMPVVRNVPVFPQHDIQPGTQWQYQGMEAHDLRDTFGIAEPFTVPFTVDYTYHGVVEKNGKKYYRIDAAYDLYYVSPVRKLIQQKNGTGFARPPALYPVRTMGYSKQQLYWDNEAGTLPFYQEVFHIIIALNTGDVVEYRGFAEAEVTDMERMDKEKIVEVLDKHIQDAGLQNTSIEKSDEGITIRIENIQFKADSAELLPSEKLKLQQLGKILADYPHYELLVSGHTARAGTEESQQVLSEERAAAVAAYLIELGVRQEQHIFTRGFGASKPVASNTDEAQRARNRRVEITLLDK